MSVRELGYFPKSLSLFAVSMCLCPEMSSCYLSIFYFCPMALDLNAFSHTQATLYWGIGIYTEKVK